MHSPSLVTDIQFREVDLFPDIDDIEHGQLFSLSLTNKTDDLTHSLHRFPAKFIPQIPRWSINQFAPKGGVVLDPFMGSGTTLVEALLSDCMAIGLDIDPLSKLITRAKTNIPSLESLRKIGLEIKDKWHGPFGELHPPMPDIANFGHWYTEDAWSKLQAIFRIIKDIECGQFEKDFLLVVFSSILRWVSNADDQSQKTYVSGTLRKTPPETMDIFWRSFERALHGVANLKLTKHPNSHAIIADGDALDMCLESATVDLIASSPPYLDSVDYMYNFMLEYFWLGPLLGIPDRLTFNTVRREHVGAKRPNKVDALPQELSDLVVLDEIPEHRRRAVISYLSDMSLHFREAARILKPGGRYVLVVGNSQTGKGIVPVHDSLVRLAACAGLNMEKAFGYRVRRHYMKFPRKGRGGIILIDWVIVLQKVSHQVKYPERLPLPWVTLGHSDVAN